MRAAEGWLELGSPREAALELAQISKKMKGHPAVLDIQWQILAAEDQWEKCIDVASQMVQEAPERYIGWIRLSYALHEVQLTEDAYNNLLGVADRFPEEPVIPYNLACYCCQLDFMEEAKDWLKQAMKTGDTEKIRETALADEDLEPLRAWIKTQ
jgi:predicted Zn-dependent protease